MANDEVVNTLGPLLADGLGGFSISAPIAFPSLADPKGQIIVQLETDVGATDFHDGSSPPDPSPPQGAIAGLPAGSALLEIHVESAERSDGISVLNSHF